MISRKMYFDPCFCFMKKSLNDESLAMDVVISRKMYFDPRFVSTCRMSRMNLRDLRRLKDGDDRQLYDNLTM